MNFHFIGATTSDHEKKRQRQDNTEQGTKGILSQLSFVEVIDD